MGTWLLILDNVYLHDLLSKVSPTLTLNIWHVHEGLLHACNYIRYEGHSGDGKGQTLSSWSPHLACTIRALLTQSGQHEY